MTAGIIAKELDEQEMNQKVQQDTFKLYKIGFVHLPFYTFDIIEAKSEVSYHDVIFVDLIHSEQYPHIWFVYYYNNDKIPGIVVWEDKMSYVTFNGKKYTNMAELHFAIKNIETEKVLDELA